MKLRCRPGELRKLLGRYSDDTYDMTEDVPRIKSQGCLSLDDLWSVARWKSPRSAGHVLKNDDGDVRELTRIALHSSGERARVEVLTLLNGVGWPTASVILHFFHEDPYPILDFRALWTLSSAVPSQYTFEFWWQYVEACRGLARKTRLSMRELDMALWQYSKEHQEPA